MVHSGVTFSQGRRTGFLGDDIYHSDRVPIGHLPALTTRGYALASRVLTF